MACETALLLVDAAQGAQAQTMAHWRTAKGLGKRIIPIINKID
jgi:translation elongation factor EF-4